MAAKPYDLSIIREHPGIPKLGEHVCEVSHRSMKGFKRENFKNIFVQSNIAAGPYDLSIIREHPDIPKARGTCV